MRKLTPFLALALATAILPAGPVAAAPPPCVGAWTIDEPDGLHGSLVDVEVAPDGTVVARGGFDTGGSVVRRADDGTWEILPSPDTTGVFLYAGGLVAHGHDDLEVVGRRSRDDDLYVARFDGAGWTIDPTTPAMGIDIFDIAHRGEGLAVLGSRDRPHRPDHLGVLRRWEGAWSWIDLEAVLEPPVPGARLRLRGVDIGAGGNLWVVGRWADLERHAFIARMGQAGEWRVRSLPALDSAWDIDLAGGRSAIGGIRRDVGVVLIGRPGDRRRIEAAPAWIDDIEMRTPSDIWLSGRVHIDGRDAAELLPRRRPDAGRSVSDVAFAPDGSVWSVGSTWRRASLVTIEHLCPWEIRGSALTPRVVRTTGTATGVIWRVPDDAAGPAILVDRSPLRLFDEVLEPRETMSFAYPGVGRYRFRDVTTGRTGVVSVALLAYRRLTSNPPNVWLDFKHAQGQGYTTEIQVQGPDDAGYRLAFVANQYATGAPWVVDQGSGPYRFRGRTIGPDGTAGDWSAATTVTIP